MVRRGSVPEVLCGAVIAAFTQGVVGPSSACGAVLEVREVGSRSRIIARGYKTLLLGGIGEDVRSAPPRRAFVRRRSTVA